MVVGQIFARHCSYENISNRLDMSREYGVYCLNKMFSYTNREISQAKNSFPSGSYRFPISRAFRVSLSRALVTGSL